MKQLTLLRTQVMAGATMGILLPLSLATIELPWLSNRVNVSCIPEGSYPILPYHSSHHGLVYHIQHVPGRSSILIHVANTTADIEGCIGVGMKYGNISNPPSIVYSRRALGLLRDYMREDAGVILIKSMVHQMGQKI
jgi:hypothetical protein